jgi:hypothetical protein
VVNNQSSGPASNGEPPVTSRQDARRTRRRYAYYDPINQVIFAGLLMMGGAILLADQLRLLPSYNNASIWAWLALGAGTVFLLAELVRALSTDFGKPNGWTLIGGVAFLGLGASAIFGVGWEMLWPAGLILIGLVLLVRNITGNR